MAAKLNSEFNYRYQVMGDTVWEKIKHLQNFLVGRKRAEALEQVAELKFQAKKVKRLNNLFIRNFNVEISEKIDHLGE